MQYFRQSIPFTCFLLALALTPSMGHAQQATSPPETMQPPDTCHEDLRGQISDYHQCQAGALNTKLRLDKEIQRQVAEVLKEKAQQLQTLQTHCDAIQHELDTLKMVPSSTPALGKD